MWKVEGERGAPRASRTPVTRGLFPFPAVLEGSDCFIQVTRTGRDKGRNSPTQSQHLPAQPRCVLVTAEGFFPSPRESPGVIPSPP